MSTFTLHRDRIRQIGVRRENYFYFVHTPLNKQIKCGSGSHRVVWSVRMHKIPQCHAHACSAYNMLRLRIAIDSTAKSNILWRISLLYAYTKENRDYDENSKKRVLKRQINRRTLRYFIAPWLFFHRDINEWLFVCGFWATPLSLPIAFCQCVLFMCALLRFALLCFAFNSHLQF